MTGAGERAATLDLLREALAAEAHEAWSGWMCWLFSLSRQESDGSAVIPAALVKRWKCQMVTPYRDLSESEQESDRREADRYLALMRGVGMTEGGTR